MDKTKTIIGLVGAGLLVFGSGFMIADTLGRSANKARMAPVIDCEVDTPCDVPIGIDRLDGNGIAGFSVDLIAGSRLMEFDSVHGLTEQFVAVEIIDAKRTRVSVADVQGQWNEGKTAHLFRARYVPRRRGHHAIKVIDAAQTEAQRMVNDLGEPIEWRGLRAWVFAR